MQKLKILYVSRKSFNDLYLLIFPIIIIIYAILKCKYLYLLFLIPCFIIICLKNKYLLLPGIIIFLIISSRLILTTISYNTFSFPQDTIICTVEEVKPKETYNQVYIRYKHKTFYFIDKEYIYKPGDKLKINGYLDNPKKAHYKGGFDYKEYLRINNNYGKISLKEITKIGHHFSFYSIHYNLYIYLKNKYPSDYGLLQALTIGEKSGLDNNLTEQIKFIGIGHLFVISGLHMDIIKKGLSFVLDKTKRGPKFKISIISIVLFFYYILSSFSISILRVLISFILSTVFEYKGIKISSIKKLLLNALIVLFIFPKYLFSYSFLLSYLVVIGIISIEEKLKKEKNFKNFILNNLFISGAGLLISLPIVISINNSINILSVIYNLFYIPFVSYILLPLSFITIILPFITKIYHFITLFFITSLEYLEKITFFNLIFPKLNIILSIIYIILTYLFLKLKGPKKQLYTFSLLSIFLLIWYFSPYINSTQDVNFLDVSLGDATFIHDGKNNTNILIDTGDSAGNDVLTYLKLKGIRKIDYVFITHSDDDHLGGIYSLIKELKIKHVVISNYDIESYNILANYPNKKYELHVISYGDKVTLKNMYFLCLGPKYDNYNINDNSLILYAEIFSLKYLFSGDIEKKGEDAFLKNNNAFDVDILKVPHHGSNTSSSDEFISFLNPKVAIAMNGYYQHFGFPSPSIIKRYEEYPNCTLYNTLYHGTITIKKKRDKYKIVVTN